MNTNPNSRHLNQPVDRRRLLRAGGLTLGAGALLAACGEPGETGLARIGEAPTTTALPAGEVTDEVLLRTATALEYNLIEAHGSIVDAGWISDSAVLAAVDGIIADHRRHAAALASLTENPVTAKSAKIHELYVMPALAAVEDADDVALDALSLAYSLEALAASTYQAFVPMLADAELRAAALRLGGEESEHAAAIALVLRPGLAGVLPAVSEDGEAVYSASAVPSAFGSLAGVDVQLGPPSDTGSREVFTFQTPSLNSLEYLD